MPIKLDEDFCLVPTDRESHVIWNNCREYDYIFRSLQNRCMAADCGYPLRDEDNFRLPYIGDVCNLCYGMYNIVAGKPFFVKAQEEADQAKRKRLGPGSDDKKD